MTMQELLEVWKIYSDANGYVLKATEIMDHSGLDRPENFFVSWKQGKIVCELKLCLGD